MRRIVLGCAVLLGAWALSSARVGAMPAAGVAAIDAAHADLSVVETVQFFHLGRPYCWYPYGWAGPGWYWCGYGTRAGLGWGGSQGWNNWVVPRTYRAYRYPPAYRWRRYH
jgi:hypothetical protein